MWLAPSPGTALAELGEPGTVKSGGGVTIRLTGTMCVTSPPLVVIFSPYVPGASELQVVIVKLAVPAPPAIVCGESVQLACEFERPDTDGVTSELKPSTEPILTVYEAVPPATAVAGLGATLSE